MRDSKQRTGSLSAPGSVIKKPRCVSSFKECLFNRFNGLLLPMSYSPSFFGVLTDHKRVDAPVKKRVVAGKHTFFSVFCVKCEVRSDAFSFKSSLLCVILRGVEKRISYILFKRGRNIIKQKKSSTARKGFSPFN